MKDRILVIDDDENMIQLLDLVLKDEYDVHKAHDMDSAKKAIKNSDFELMLVDLRLGGEDGHELITYIRKEIGLEWIPLMILSGRSKSDERIKCFEEGADDYMVKPFNPVELKHRIKRHIQKYAIIKGA
jgi:DNA-binding response OmpR family regulator